MSDNDQNEDQQIGLNAYEARQEARRERYEAAADAAERRANRRFDSASAQVAGIPFGQPILVGHHSEGRHRNALKRHDSHMRAGINESDKAAHYRAKAAGVGQGGISSDDPEAVRKLKEKLAKCTELQETMKRLNATWRKYKKNPDSAATAKALAALTEKERDIVIGFEPQYSWEKGPAQDYQLKNNGAEIRRLKKRIAELERAAEREPVEPIKGNGYEFVQNREENRVQFIFDGKPSKEIRDKLKSHSFRWSPRNGAWQRHSNNQGLYAAQAVQQFLDEQQPPQT